MDRPDIRKSAEALEQLLTDLESADLPIAAAHISTALELLKREVRKKQKNVKVKLKIVSGNFRP